MSGQMAKAEKCAREALGKSGFDHNHLESPFSSKAELERPLESARPHSRSHGRGLIRLLHASRRGFSVSALIRL